MLRKSGEIPYMCKGVTFIWKEKGEWHFCHDVATKKELIAKKPKEMFCAWTGNYTTDIFEIDSDLLSKEIG